MSIYIRESLLHSALAKKLGEWIFCSIECKISIYSVKRKKNNILEIL